MTLSFDTLKITLLSGVSLFRIGPTKARQTIVKNKPNEFYDMDKNNCFSLNNICSWKNKKQPTKPDYQNDFGQYAELWKNHKDNYKNIIRITENYIVYINKENKIDWETTSKHDENISGENKKKYEKALSQCSITEHKPLDGLSETSQLSFKTIIGESVVNCFEGNISAAVEILMEAEKFRIDRIVEKSREWYLSYTLTLSAFTILLVATINKFSAINSEELLQRINFGTWAVLGACLSIILRSGQLRHASYAGKSLHFVESVSRLVGGAISGMIAYFAIKSGIIFSSLVTIENKQYATPLLTLLAGASERFAPSIITKIENISSVSEKPKEESQ